jgi:molecular chaperone DnaJ
MAAINEAYRVLSDPGRRAVYDRGLDGGNTGSAAPTSVHPTDDVRTTMRAHTYNYPADLAPARVPWKLLGVMASIGIGFVLAGAILIDSPAERAPDGIIRSGSCVEIEANNDAREVRAPARTTSWSTSSCRSTPAARRAPRPTATGRVSALRA